MGQQPVQGRTAKAVWGSLRNGSSGAKISPLKSNFNLERIRDAKQLWYFGDDSAGLLCHVSAALHFGRLPGDNFRARLGAVGRRTEDGQAGRLADSEPATG